MDVTADDGNEVSNKRNLSDDDRENEKVSFPLEQIIKEYSQCVQLNQNDISSSNLQLPKMKCNPKTKIRFTAIPAQYPSESTPAEITKHSMDSSYQLDQYLNIFKR